MEQIALLPGGFKPPHAGHYNMAKWLATNTDADTVVIKIGSKERDGITREMSLKLWNLYRITDPDAPKLAILASENNSPVADVYDFIEQEAPEGSIIYLGMGEKDIEDTRYNNIGKFAKPKNIEFETVLVPPQAGGVSGTEMRGFINNGDKESFQQYLPEHLTPEQKDEAWDVVSSIQEDFYDPRNKYYDFAKSSEWKAGYRGKKDIPRKGDQIHNRQKSPVSFEEGIIKEETFKTYGDLKDFIEAIRFDKGKEKYLDVIDNAIGLIPYLGTVKSGIDVIKALLTKQDGKTTNTFLDKMDIDDKASAIVDDKVEANFINYMYDVLMDADPQAPLPSDFNMNDYFVAFLSSEYDKRTIDGIQEKVLKEQKGGKILRVYDFDDTLAVTKGANIKIKHADGSIDILDPAEFATYEEQPGDKFDFTEFDRVIKDAEPIQNIVSMLRKDLETTAKVTILTARLIAYPVRRYLKSLDLDAYVVAVGSSDPQDKSNWIKNHIEKGYKDILFIDDSEKNRNAVLNLKDEYPDIKLDVQDPNSIKEMMGTMNNQEKRKHAKNLKRLKKDLKKQGDQYIEVPNYLKGTLTRKLYKEQYRPKTPDNPYNHDEIGHYTTNNLEINGKNIPVEVMRTPEEQTTGMMGRKEMKSGMIFPYDKVSIKDFHMEDCLIPLDIVFINNNNIDTIHDNCPPCKETPCPKYSGLADNVLELPGGYCKKNNINVGDKVNLNLTEETNVFTKEWWKEIILEQLLTEGGAAGHMAHPFNLPNVNSGKDLKDVFNRAAESLQTNPGSVKIDGVNSSIRLIDLDGEKQFVMDRGSKKELDIQGITKADLEDRFGDGHGMIKIGGEVLDMFNEALPSLQSDLEKLGAWDNPNILFNMEYVSGKTNVQDYGSNFIAIHGLNQIESKEVEGKRGPLTKRVSSEISYDKSTLQSLLDNLAPIAKEKGFEVYGSVPTEMTKKPDFSSALSTSYTIVSNEGEKTQNLDAWLNELDVIPEEEFIFMNVDNSKKKVGAVSKQVYTTLLSGNNIDELFEDEEDKQKAIEGFTTYLATEKLGDEVLKVLDSPMGSVDNHEGVVIRDESIANIPFKITGKFILGGLSSDF